MYSNFIHFVAQIVPYVVIGIPLKLAFKKMLLILLIYKMQSK